MCGIAGILQARTTSKEVLADRLGGLLGAISHRGPDSWGIRFVHQRGLIGACRLGITDPHNEVANMPMESACGRFLLVFNGEVYNYKTLKARLAPYYQFQTESDTEVVLAAYTRWGTRCVEFFDGMFAFCLYDRERDEAFLAVDPTGQKPLYFSLANGEFRFCSELVPLTLEPELTLSLNRGSLLEVLLHGYSFGVETPFEGVRRMLPGHRMLLKANGSGQQERYYTLPVTDRYGEDVERVVQELRQAIALSCKEAVCENQSSKLFLSGGLDSTMVLHHLIEAGHRPSTSSICTGSAEDSELEPALEIAAHYKTTHSEHVVSVEEYFSRLDSWHSCMDDPIASREAACLMKLCESLHGKQRVVYTGTGADELFDGYGNGHSLLSQIPCSTTSPEKFGEIYASQFRFLGSLTPESVLEGTEQENALLLATIAHKFQQIVDPYRAETSDLTELCQIVNFNSLAPRFEHHQMDRIGMRHHIEVRSPLASRRIADLACSFDPRLKHKDGNEKWILKKAMQGVLPESSCQKRKRAFPVWRGLWSSQPFLQRVDRLLEPGSHVASLGLVNMKKLSRMRATPADFPEELFFRLVAIEGYLSALANRRSQVLRPGRGGGDERLWGMTGRG